MSAYALVTLRLASGEVVGPLNVYGAGGVVCKHGLIREYFEVQIRRANVGAHLWCYEPAPGHCLMLRSGRTDEESRRVDLRGAVIIDVS